MTRDRRGRRTIRHGRIRAKSARRSPDRLEREMRRAYFPKGDSRSRRAGDRRSLESHSPEWDGGTSTTMKSPQAFTGGANRRPFRLTRGNQDGGGGGLAAPGGCDMPGGGFHPDINTVCTKLLAVISLYRLS